MMRSFQNFSSSSSTTGAQPNDEEILSDESINIEYHALLADAKTTDLSDLEKSGCVVLSRKSENHDPVILFLPKLGFLLETSTNNNQQDNSNGSGDGDNSTTLLKKMLLLFIKKAHTLVHRPFTLAYGHTPMSLLSQHPVIYQYYKILPRQYKKNLKNLYIVHPQMGIKLFFEFARVFLSHKFYNKLILLDNIAGLQQLFPFVTSDLPLRFIKLEDDEQGLKFNGTIPPLTDTFIAPVGTTKIIADCVSYLRESKALSRRGLFRIAGDDMVLSMAKVRMNAIEGVDIPATVVSSSIPASSTAESRDSTLSRQARLSLPRASIANMTSNPITATGIPPVNAFIVHDKVIIGRIKVNESLEINSEKEGSSSPSRDGAAAGNKAAARRGSTLGKTFTDVLSGRRSKESKQRAVENAVLGHQSLGISNDTTGHTLSMSLHKSEHISSDPNTNIPAVCFTDIDTVAQILKFSLRQLPEPLITTDAYRELMAATSKLKSKEDDSYSSVEWAADVKQIIHLMPTEHKATLNHLLYFLAEVASYSAINMMDSSNLGVVFAPTIMRSIAEDHGTMLAEMGFSKSVVTHLIDNFSPYFVPAEAPEEASCNVVNDTTSLATSDTLDSSLSAQIESGLSLGMLSRVNMCTANNPVRAKSLSVALPAGILQLARETYKEENGRPSSSQINISEETLQQFEKGLSPEMVHRFQRQRNNSTGTLQPPLAAISESESKEDETSN